MTSFLLRCSLNLHIWWTLPRAISLKGFNVVNCPGQVLQRNHKNTYFWDWKFSYFVNLFINYQSGNFQVIQLSESNFIRHPKTPLLRHYDVTSQYLVLKISHFVEHNRNYQSAKFHWPGLSGSNFMRAREKHQPLDLQTQKAQSV